MSPLLPVSVYVGWYKTHILDALMKNRSQVQHDMLHADTQGQNEPVFGLCQLLGLKRMPRMRSMSDIVFYRPRNSLRYQHLGTLFRADVLKAVDDLQAPPGADDPQVKPAVLKCREYLHELPRFP